MWSYEYPIGAISIVEEDGAITRAFMGRGNKSKSDKSDIALRETPLIKKAAKQLGEYFAGRRKVFDLPLAPRGTAFQQDVWKAVQAIESGATRSYKEIAELVGRPAASRAVGMANGRNPLIVIIPCHRVVGQDGSLTGYAGGLDAKRFLLDLEKRHA
jgi:O-6-methylguanine DNA methyltransferase